MSEYFRAWLVKELDTRRWSHRELARKIGLSHSIVSKTISGERHISADFCIRVANVFSEPPEKLLRLADILPSIDPDGRILQELVDLAKALPREEQLELLKFARFRFQQVQRSPDDTDSPSETL